MIRAASALVRDVPDGRAAAAAGLRQAARKLEAPPDAAIVFATPQYRSAADAILEEMVRAGCRSVVGGCASGVLTDEGEAESGRAIALLLLSGGDLRAFHVEKDAPLRPGVPGGGVAVILPDPSSVDLADLVNGFDSEREFRPLFGGALSGGGEHTGHFLFCGNRVVAGGTGGFTLSGSPAVGISQGCRPIGRPLVITRAHGHMVLGLAGRAPLDVLRDTLQHHAREEGGPGGPVMAGIAVDSSKSPLRRGDFLVRNLLAVQKEDASVLAVGTPVRVGQTLVFHLMDRASAVEDMKEMVGELREQLPEPPAFGLYFNCRGRGKNLFGETDHDVLALRSGIGAFPMAGFFGNAEFAPVGKRNWMHNYTGVFVAVRSGEKGERQD